jgi:hypothetical protein
VQQHREIQVPSRVLKDLTATINDDGRLMTSGSRCHVPAKYPQDVIAKRVTNTRGYADRQSRVKRKKHGVHRPGVVAQRSDAR